MVWAISGGAKEVAGGSRGVLVPAVMLPGGIGGGRWRWFLSISRNMKYVLDLDCGLLLGGYKMLHNWHDFFPVMISLAVPE